MDPILELFQGYENQIKAAVAYCLNADKYEDEPSTFAWSCGGYHALCEIKAAGVQRRLGRGEPGRQIVEKVTPNIFVVNVVDVHFSQVKLGFYAGGESEMIYLGYFFVGILV